MTDPTLERLKNQFRRDVDDIDLDPADQSGLLWSDADILHYLNVAQQEFVHDTLYLRKNLSLVVTAEEPLVVLPERVIELKSSKAYLSTAGVVINEVNRDDQLRHTDDYGATLVTNPFESMTPGRPYAFTLDMDERFIRLLPASATEDTLEITAYVEADELDDWNCSLDITRRRHQDMLLAGMKREAYLKSDADTYNREEAQLWAGIFEQHKSGVFDERQKRQERPPTVRYGGI